MRRAPTRPSQVWPAKVKVVMTKVDRRRDWPRKVRSGCILFDQPRIVGAVDLEIGVNLAQALMTNNALAECRQITDAAGRQHIAIVFPDNASGNSDPSCPGVGKCAEYALGAVVVGNGRPAHQNIGMGRSIEQAIAFVAVDQAVIKDGVAGSFAVAPDIHDADQRRVLKGLCFA